MKIWLALLAGLLSSWAYCAPKPFFVSARLVIFPFDPNTAYTIYTRVGSITNITFSGEEHVQGLYLSDSIQWVTTVTPDKQDIFIKPTQEGLNNAGTLITNKHKYQLLFVSINGDKTWYQRVSWYHHGDAAYPGMSVLNMSLTPARQEGDQLVSQKPAVQPSVQHEADQQTTRSKRIQQSAVEEVPILPSQLNFRYRIRGQADFRPLMIFDNGQRTWMRLPDSMAHAPAVFEMAMPDRHVVVVNYTLHNSLLVLPHIAAWWLLKIGHQEVRIQRLIHCALFDFRCRHNLPDERSDQ